MSRRRSEKVIMQNSPTQEREKREERGGGKKRRRMDLRVATRERNKAARHEGKVKTGGAWTKWAELKLQKS